MNAADFAAIALVSLAIGTLAARIIHHARRANA